jgi:hypothetical protein
MQEFSLELANTTARVNCSCCNSGMTSVCGFISRFDRPYAVYYALIHNNRKDIFVRLSVSVGEWWRHESYENRHAMCMDVTPARENWRITLRDAIYSPQQGFAKFGIWLGSKEDRKNPLVEEIMEVANFVILHDPAVLTYLTGRRADYTGRDVQHLAEN